MNLVGLVGHKSAHQVVIFVNICNVDEKSQRKFTARNITHKFINIIITLFNRRYHCVSQLTRNIFFVEFCRPSTLQCSQYHISTHVSNIMVFVRFEVFTAVTMKNGVFWDVTPCGSCKSRRFRGT
jgi:predicted transcriptional regulator